MPIQSGFIVKDGLLYPIKFNRYNHPIHTDLRHDFCPDWKKKINCREWQLYSINPQYYGKYETIPPTAYNPVLP